MTRLFISACLALWLAGCAATGSTTAERPTPHVSVARNNPLERYRGLAVVMPEYLETRPDMVTRLRNLGVFDQVIRSEDLPRFVASHALQGQVTDLRKWGGYQSLARAYKPFLIFWFDCLDARDGVRYQLGVRRADTLDDVYVGDVRVLSAGQGQLMGLLTLGAGMRPSNCWGATDHGAVDGLFDSMSQWLRSNLPTSPDQNPTMTTSP